MQTVRDFAIAAVLIGGLALLASPFVPSRAEVEHSKPFPACVAEDYSNCYWDAAKRSNGEGISFVDIGGTVITVSN